MKSLLILGRQPALGLAELESLYHAENIKAVGHDAALIDIDPAQITFARLGGSIKLTKVLHILDTIKWQDIEEYLSKTIPAHLKYVPEGKFTLGLSAYGLRARPEEINATGIRIKKTIKKAGRSVRIVPNKSAALNSAQVLHNQLATSTGWELVMVRNGKKTILAQTVEEQDIEAYAARDQNRPFRDARVGMLPPKLAQIIINLAVDNQNINVILDPFCGTGVLLQEANLMGYDCLGTDIEPRMVEFSKKNIEWLHSSYLIRLNSRASGLLPSDTFALEIGDVTKHTWGNFDVVACETYLGKPMVSLPPRHVLTQIRQECDDIHEKFLRNIGSQLQSGTRLCLAVPAWRLKEGFLHLKTLDHLESLGYNRLSFVHARNSELVYHRPDQLVGRELVVLEKK